MEGNGTRFPNQVGRVREACQRRWRDKTAIYYYESKGWLCDVCPAKAARVIDADGMVYWLCQHHFSLSTDDLYELAVGGKELPHGELEHR